MLPRVITIALLAAASVLGQVNGPYPGGTYPPGSYPPGTYPGGRGGGGNGIPIPGRSKRGSASEPKTTITISGKIARAEESDKKNLLTVAADDGRMIEFRIAQTTTVEDSAHKLAVSDLNVGDEVTVEAHTDEKGFFYAESVHVDKAAEIDITAETRGRKERAVDLTSAGTDDPDRPRLRRAGAPGDAPKSDAPASAGATPKPSQPEESTGEERPIIPPGGVTAASNDPNRPVLRRGAPADRPRAVEEVEQAPTPSPIATNRPVEMPGTSTPRGGAPEPERREDGAIDVTAVARAGDPVIEKAREAAAEFDRTLPNFVCQEMVARYQSESRKPNWQAQDILSYDLVYLDGKEQYHNPKINGKAVKSGADKESGSWSTGEFGSMLQDLFHPATAADFKPRGQETISHRTARTYSFAVDKDHSHWRIAAEAQWIQPAYRGMIWVDKETYRVLRIEMEAVAIPKAFPFDHTESAVDYQMIRIGATNSYLLPVHAEVLNCQRGTSLCSKNAIDFRNYHAYAGESSIRFDDPK